jgi:hypothetical protein
VTVGNEKNKFSMHNSGYHTNTSSAKSNRRMEMRKTYVYLLIALMLSLLLSGCADSTDNGMVTASPWPAVTEPVLPVPTAIITATPVPDMNRDDRNTGTNAEDDFENNMLSPERNDLETATPSPTDNNR